jgi:hypothetical protein
MKVKKILLCSFTILSLVACSNANSIAGATDEEREALKILEEKREYYQKLDKEKAKEIEKQEQEQITEANTTEEDITKKPADTTEEIKTEKEKLANMTADERLIYRVDKAKEKIDSMLETAKKARQEELDVEETKAKVENAIKNITGEKAPETATIVEEAK